MDIKATTDAGGGYFVGWAEGGEWLEYTFDVAQAGQYTIDTRVASPKTGGSFEYVILGSNTLGGTQQVPNTGSFTTFRTVTSPQFELDPGRHTVRFRVNQGNVVGGVANFNWFRLNHVGDVDDQQPTTPPNARATGATSTSVSLDWDAATDNVGLSGYRVVTTDGLSVIDSQFVPAEQTAFTVTGLQPDRNYTFEIRAVDLAGNVSQEAAIVNARTSAVSTGQQAFYGSPFNPGVNIQAEDYDRGGEGVSFHDLDATNRGSASTYRTGADVGPDIYTRSFGRSVGYVQVGEWLEYTINVPTAGNYDLSFRVANPAAGARVSFQLDGNALGNPATVPNTGSWNTYSTVTTGPVALPVGTHVLRLSFDASASSGSVGDFDWVRFSGPTGGTVDTQPPTAPEITSWVARAEEVELNWIASTDNVGVAGYEIRRGGTLLGTVGGTVRQFIDPFPSAPYAYSYSVTAYDAAGNRSPRGEAFVEYASQNPAQDPFKGSPFNPGQTIQAEDFDTGGEGIAYHDNDSINRGPSTYRPGTGVDLYTGPHGVNIGYVQPGEWTEYTVNIPEAGDYHFAVRAAHVQPGARFSLSMVKDNLQEWSASANVPNTGSWNNYGTITLPTASLPAGVYTLRLSFDTAAANGSVGNYDSIQFTAADTEPTELAQPDFAEIYGTDSQSITFYLHGDGPVPEDTQWRIERLEGSTWVPVFLLPPGSGGSFTDEDVEPRSTQTYRARAERDGEVTAWREFRASTSRFDENDIGSPSPAGGTSSIHGGSAYVIQAGGRDIHGSADQFHFGNFPIAGDFDFQLTLNGINPASGSTTPVDPWAKVGLMARESLAADSRNVAIVQSYQNGPRFQVRSTTGGWTSTSGTGANDLRATVRMRRVGDTFITYQKAYLSDTWVEIGRVTLDLPDTIYFGIAATSHNQGSGIQAGTSFFRSAPE